NRSQRVKPATVMSPLCFSAASRCRYFRQSVYSLVAAATWWSVAGGFNNLARAGSQPQWGEAWSRNMISSERGLVQDFDPKSGRNIRWNVPLGTETHSTPIVAGGRVYIGTNNGQPRDPRDQADRGVLMCFDERNGQFLWQVVVPKREEDPYFDWPKSGVSSPVTVEGDRVYLVNN